MMDEKVYNLISSAVSCMHDSEYIAAQSCATIAQAISSPPSPRAWRSYLSAYMGSSIRYSMGMRLISSLR